MNATQKIINAVKGSAVETVNNQNVEEAMNYVPRPKETPLETFVSEQLGIVPEGLVKVTMKAFHSRFFIKAAGTVRVVDTHMKGKTTGILEVVGDELQAILANPPEEVVSLLTVPAEVIVSEGLPAPPAEVVVKLPPKSRVKVTPGPIAMLGQIATEYLSDKGNLVPTSLPFGYKVKFRPAHSDGKAIWAFLDIYRTIKVGSAGKLHPDTGESFQFSFLVTGVTYDKVAEWYLQLESAASFALNKIAIKKAKKVAKGYAIKKIGK